MTLRQIDLTTALRPSLLPEEVLLFVQDDVGLYRDKYKIEGHQNGHAYLTSHRICYVDNDEPRQRSVAIDLKDIDYPELYAGFLKSSPKITLYPKASKKTALPIRTPAYSPAFQTPSSSPTRQAFSSPTPPPPRETNATWICPICSFSNPVPSNFDPATANANTPLPPCLACGIKPPLVHVTKAAIAAMSNRPAGNAAAAQSSPATRRDSSDGRASSLAMPTPTKPTSTAYNECPRCTFRNHPSILTCEICGASLPSARNPQLTALNPSPSRSESPAPTTSASTTSSYPEIIKLSFRNGGVQPFHDRLKDALIQRKWLLVSAPPIPQPSPSTQTSASRSSPQVKKGIGIAGLERRDLELRKNNEFVIGSAFEDLEALMTSAKEVIAMAERFSSSSASLNPETSRLLSESASALGLMATRDMLSPSGSGAEKTYLAQLSRDLAEYLTDDRTGILRKEGGIMTLVDLWAVFNRRRNGIELISPRDFESAAMLWEGLRLPLRLRRFKSGVLVVQGRERTDEKTCKSLVEWLRSLKNEPLSKASYASFEETGVLEISELEPGYDVSLYGRGVTVQETAEKFGWSLGVAGEELEMAEDTGVLVRDMDVRGVRFWENHFADMPVPEAAG